MFQNDRHYGASYATKIMDLIETGEWKSREEPAITYIEDIHCAYGENTRGEDMRVYSRIYFQG